MFATKTAPAVFCRRCNLLSARVCRPCLFVLFLVSVDGHIRILFCVCSASAAAGSKPEKRPLGPDEKECPICFNGLLCVVVFVIDCDCILRVLIGFASAVIAEHVDKCEGPDKEVCFAAPQFV